MRRQLRAKGVITDVVQRTNYWFGGIKDRIRKLIPNEIANDESKIASEIKKAHLHSRVGSVWSLNSIASKTVAINKRRGKVEVKT